MKIIINTLIALVALLHIYFLILEMFLWTTPKGLKVFSQSLEKAQASKVLAANQGLYNGFLAVGLIWGLINSAQDFKIFFLLCVIVAGLYGGHSVGKKILIVQAFPAALALGLLLIF